MNFIYRLFPSFFYSVHRLKALRFSDKYSPRKCIRHTISIRRNSEEKVICSIKYLFISFCSSILTVASIVQWCKKTNDTDKEQRMRRIDILFFPFSFCFNGSSNLEHFYSIQIASTYWRCCGNKMRFYCSSNLNCFS